MDGVQPNRTRSPVGTVGAVCVSPDKHVFTGPDENEGRYCEKGATTYQNKEH